MALPSNQSKPETLAEALEKFKAQAGAIKVFAQDIKGRSAGGPISATDIVNYANGLRLARAELTRLAALQGLAAYAATEYPTLNLTTDYNACVSQIDTTLAWIAANFPKAASGELLERKLDATGTVTVNTFASATLATFRSQLDLLIATID